MSLIDVPRAELYYEARGDGPLLVLIPGANGDSGIYTPLATQLAEQFTVVTYDRRGYSRSQQTRTGTDENPLETDADDVRRLVEHVGDERAYVFGSSSGGVIALNVLLDHPSVVDTLIAHEPPLMSQLPDADWWEEFVEEIYGTYEQSGIGPAMGMFAERMMSESDAAMMQQRRDGEEMDETTRQNTERWFEVELKATAAYELDIDTLGNRSERLVLASGRASAGTPPHQATAVLAEELGLDVLDVPDGHLGYATQPQEFAQDMLDELAQRDTRYYPH